MKLRICLVALTSLLAVLALTRLTFAQEPNARVLRLENSPQEYRLEPYLELLHDPTGQLSLQEVLSPAYASQFAPDDDRIPSLGFGGSTYWIRLRVQNDSTRSDWLLNLEDPRISFLDFYPVAKDSSPLQAIHTGDSLPFATRQSEYKSFALPLDVPAGSERDFYVRVQSPVAVDVAAVVITPDLLATQERNTFLVYGLFYGAMLIMAGYNLLVFLSLRDRTYLYLALFILGLAASKVAQDGLGHQFLWSQIGSDGFSEATMIFTMLAASFFTTSFLGLETRAPSLNLAFKVWRGLVLFLVLLIPFFNVLPVAAVLIGIEFVLILSSIVRVLQSGYRPARLFLVTWILPLVATAIYVLYSVGIVSRETLSSYPVLVFLAALALLWSLVLADRIQVMQTEAESANRNLARSERQYRSLFQDSRDAVFIAANTGEMLDLNPAGLHLLGYTRPDLAALNISQLFQAPADYERFETTLTRQGFVMDYEAQMRGKEGAPIATLVTSTRWRDEERGISGYQGILRDVTERRRTQAELATYRLDLEQLVAARTTQANTELVERRRAEAELDRRVQELLVLNEIARTISSVTDLVPALERVAERMTYLFDVNSTLIGELEPDGMALRILVHYPQLSGSRTNVRTIAPDAIPILKQVVATHESYRLAELSDAPELEGLSELVNTPNARCVLLIPLRAGGIVSGILLLSSPRAGAFDENDGVHLAETIGGTIATAIENARLYEQAQATAAADERQRLARELHDSVTQLLYSIVLMAGGWSIQAKEDSLDREEAEQSFSELAGLAQQALGEMRLLLYQLRAPVLREMGLSGALRQRLNAVENRVGIQTQLQVQGEVDTLMPEVQEELYLIAQEALNNSLRHAQATLVEVQVAKVNQQLELLVRDNGTGFEPTAADDSEGMGLQNMYARARDIGAELDIASVPGQGTRVQVRLALEPVPVP